QWRTQPDRLVSRVAGASNPSMRGWWLLSLACASLSGQAPQVARRAPMVPDIAVLATGGDAIREQRGCWGAQGTQTHAQRLWRDGVSRTSAPPELAAPSGPLLFVFLGPGPGDRVEFVEALRCSSPPFLVLRLRPQGTARSPGRFCLLRVG